MALDEDVQGRLYNWKFDSAQDMLDVSKATPQERQAIKALAETFGNVGYFGGTLAGVVQAAVYGLIGEYGDG